MACKCMWQQNANQNLYSSKIRFLFSVLSINDYKVSIAQFLLHRKFCADTLKNLVIKARKLPKIGILTPLKSDIYYRFISRTTWSNRSHFQATCKICWKLVTTATTALPVRRFRTLLTGHMIPCMCRNLYGFYHRPMHYFGR